MSDGSQHVVIDGWCFKLFKDTKPMTVLPPLWIGASKRMTFYWEDDGSLNNSDLKIMSITKTVMPNKWFDLDCELVPVWTNESIYRENNNE